MALGLLSLILLLAAIGIGGLFATRTSVLYA